MPSRLAAAQSGHTGLSTNQLLIIQPHVLK